MPPDPAAAARYAAMAAEQRARQEQEPAVLVGGSMGGAAALPAGHLQVYAPGRPMEAFAYRTNDGRVALRSPQGQRVLVPEAEAQARINKGYKPIDVGEYQAEVQGEKEQEATGQAFVGGVVSGLSGGASDAMSAWGGTDEMGTPSFRAAEAARRGAHGGLTTPMAGHLARGRIAEASPYATELGAAVGTMAAVAAGPLMGRIGGAMKGRVAPPAGTKATRQLAKVLQEDTAGQLSRFGRPPRRPTVGTVTSRAKMAERIAADAAAVGESRAAELARVKGYDRAKALQTYERQLRQELGRFKGRKMAPEERPAGLWAKRRMELDSRIAAGEASPVEVALESPSGRYARKVFSDLTPEQLAAAKAERQAFLFPSEAEAARAPFGASRAAPSRAAMEGRVSPLKFSEGGAKWRPDLSKAAAKRAAKAAAKGPGEPPRWPRVQPEPSPAVLEPPATGYTQEFTPGVTGEMRGAAAADEALMGRLMLGENQPARAALPGSTLDQVVRTGAVEGALYSGGRELAEQAYSEERELRVLDIAREALEGAAVGSSLSLAGAGLAGVAGRIGKRLRVGIQRKAGVDVPRLEALVARQKALKDRLVFTSGVEARTALKEQLKLHAGLIKQERIKVFQLAGNALGKLRAPIGVGAYGFSIQSLILGSAVQGVSNVLRSRLVAGTAHALARGAGRAAKTVVPPVAGLTKIRVLDLITDSDAEALAVQLEVTDAEEVGQAAVQGYHLAGIDEAMAGYLADFQKKRVELLQQVIQRRPDSTGRVVASRVLNAVEDPRRIFARLSSGAIWGEDLLVLQYLFPEVYEDLQRQATALANRPGLTGRQRLDLMKLAGAPQLGQVTASIQAALKPQPQKGQGGRRYNPAQNAQTESQRLQGGQQ